MTDTECCVLCMLCERQIWVHGSLRSIVSVPPNNYFAAEGKNEYVVCVVVVVVVMSIHTLLQIRRFIVGISPPHIIQYHLVVS